MSGKWLVKRKSTHYGAITPGNLICRRPILILSVVAGFLGSNETI